MPHGANDVTHSYVRSDSFARMSHVAWPIDVYEYFIRVDALIQHPCRVMTNSNMSHVSCRTSRRSDRDLTRICTRVYIYTYLCVYRYIYTYIHICIFSHIFAVYTYTYILMLICGMCKSSCAYTACIYENLCIYIYTYTYTHTYSYVYAAACRYTYAQSPHIYIRAYTNICIYVYIYTHIHPHIYLWHVDILMRTNRIFM